MENIPGYLNIAITLAITFGCAIAFRYGMNRTANEIQDRVIKALESEIQTLQDRIVALENDNSRLSQTITVIRAVLKHRGLSITIDGDLVSLHDLKGYSTYTGHIQNCATSSGVEEHERI